MNDDVGVDVEDVGDVGAEVGVNVGEEVGVGLGEELFASTTIVALLQAMLTRVPLTSGTR